MSLRTISADLRIIVPSKCGGNHLSAVFRNPPGAGNTSDFESSAFTIFVIREPMDRLVSNFCFWTQGPKTIAKVPKVYVVSDRFIDFEEYCIRVCKYRFEKHTEDQYEELRHVRKVDYWLPLEDFDRDVDAIRKGFPNIRVTTPPEHGNQSNREVDWFSKHPVLQRDCEKSYGIDMALYGTAKNCTITLEEAIDRWRCVNPK